MEPPDTQLGLSVDDALSLWVGRVARAHALLEHGVDNVHRVLARAAGGQPSGKAEKGFDQLVTECITMLRELGSHPEIQTAGSSALVAARGATSMRNRIVHDMWLPDHSSDGSAEARWSSFRRSSDPSESYGVATPQHLAAVIDAHTMLLRTRMRVSGLFMSLHTVSLEGRSRAGGSSDGEGLATYFALMTDRFVLHPNGDFDIT